MNPLAATGDNVVAHPRAFIFSAYIGPGHGVITLRGEVDTEAAADLLGAHLDGFVGAAALTISVDATAVTSYTPQVLALLGHAQRRLAARGGVVSVLGLHPSALPDTPPTFPTPVLVDDQPPAPAPAAWSRRGG